MQPNNEFSFGNLDDVKTSDEPIPVGNYRLRAVEMDMKDTKSGTGSYLSVRFDVVEGPHQGRRVFQNYNLVNQNQQAVEIALRDVKSWLIAAGLPESGQLTMERIRALEGKPFLAKVGIEKDKSGQYPDKNKIARFLPPVEGSAPAAATASPQPPAAEAPASSGGRPWE